MWVMGLAGLAGAGAASFVITREDAEPEEDEVSEEQSGLEPADFSNGNLLDQLDGFGPDQAADEDWTDDNDDYLYDLIAAPDRSGDPAIRDAWSEDLTEPEPEHAEDAGISAVGAGSAAALPTDAAPVSGPALLDTWIAGGAPAEPLDYDRSRDSLVLVWDDMAEDASEPAVGVAPDPDDPEVMHVTMNGSSVAEIYGEPNLAPRDLTVIPLSSAMIAGLQPAA